MLTKLLFYKQTTSIDEEQQVANRIAGIWLANENTEKMKVKEKSK